MWRTNFPLPQSYCQRLPELRNYGFGRVLNDGRIELISVCNPVSNEMIGVSNDDFNRILDALVPSDRQ